MVHTTAYCGSLERACLKEGIPILSISSSPVHHAFTSTTVANKLIEDRVVSKVLVASQDWKTQTGLVGKCTPKYKPDFVDETPMTIEKPDLFLCEVQDGRLCIPGDLRSRWVACPIRAPEWRQILTQFDKQWAVDVSEQPKKEEKATPAPSQPATSPGTDGEEVKGFDWQEVFPEEPKSKEALESKYGAGAHRFNVTDNNLVMVLVEGPKLFILALAESELDGREPILCYGAGTWLLDNKAESLVQDRLMAYIAYSLGYIEYKIEIRN